MGPLYTVFLWAQFLFVLAQKCVGILGSFPVRDPGDGIRLYYSAQIAVDEWSRDLDHVLNISSLFRDLAAGSQ